MKKFKKEILNQNRLLTMSTNRTGDYLIIDPDYQTKSSTIMVVKSHDGSVNDLIFIKQIKSTDEIFDICFEFNIKKILVDVNGLGISMYDNIVQCIKLHKVSNIFTVVQVKGHLNKDLINNELEYISQDIENGKLRFLQSTNCARVSYRKSFLGYSEIMNCHKETDKLVQEMGNIDIAVDYHSYIRINSKDNINRFRCLMIYYSTYIVDKFVVFLNGEEKEIINPKNK